MAQLICEGVSLSYERNIVLSDLNFSLNAGDYLCVVGENGSGKSTLVKALLGLKEVSAGSIAFGDGLRRQEIGYLPQQSSIQRDFPASVREIVLSGRLNSRGWKPFYSAEDRKIAEEKMEKMGIAGLAGRSFSQLSGGQQQRVLLARALCATRSMLLLDEPTAGLDPVVTAELYRLIAAINAEGITVIMVSHDMASAVQWASHILHIAKKPLFFGTTAQYIDSPAGKHFLGEHQREAGKHPCPFDGEEGHHHA